MSPFRLEVSLMLPLEPTAGESAVLHAFGEGCYFRRHQPGRVLRSHTVLQTQNQQLHRAGKTDRETGTEVRLVVCGLMHLGSREPRSCLFQSLDYQQLCHVTMAGTQIQFHNLNSFLL